MTHLTKSTLTRNKDDKSVNRRLIILDTRRYVETVRQKKEVLMTSWAWRQNAIRLKPLTHDPSRRPVMTGSRHIRHDRRYFGSHLDDHHDGRQDRSWDNGCQKTTPIVTAIMTARHHGPS